LRSIKASLLIKYNILMIIKFSECGNDWKEESNGYCLSGIMLAG